MATRSRATPTSGRWPAAFFETLHQCVRANPGDVRSSTRSRGILASRPHHVVQLRQGRQFRFLRADQGLARLGQEHLVAEHIVPVGHAGGAARLRVLEDRLGPANRLFRDQPEGGRHQPLRVSTGRVVGHRLPGTLDLELSDLLAHFGLTIAVARAAKVEHDPLQLQFALEEGMDGIARSQDAARRSGRTGAERRRGGHVAIEPVDARQERREGHLLLSLRASNVRQFRPQTGAIP